MFAYTADKRAWLVALDMATETYRQIPVPDEIGPDVNPYVLKLVELSGCLFLVRWLLREHVDVWMIKDFDSGCKERMWTRSCR